MKLQYLGDSKDSFKWDYHDHLVAGLGYELLNIVLMMTPDDGGTYGKTKATQYPARSSVLEFCHLLRNRRDLDVLRDLPKTSSSKYRINIHSKDHLPAQQFRHTYFDGFSPVPDQVVLVDPDNGFEPQKSFLDKHLLFSELERITEQISERSVVSVFQHFRRRPFVQDFSSIQQRIISGYSTAICWHSLMFVLVTRSSEVHRQLIEQNEAYASKQPVYVIT